MEDTDPSDSGPPPYKKYPISRKQSKIKRIGSVLVRPNPKRWLKDLFSDKIRYKSSLKLISSEKQQTSIKVGLKTKKAKKAKVKVGPLSKERIKKSKLKQKVRDVFSDTTVYKPVLKKKKKIRKVYVTPKENPLPPDADRGKKIMGIYPWLFRDEDPGYVDHLPEDVLFDAVKGYREKNPEFSHVG